MKIAQLEVDLAFELYNGDEDHCPSFLSHPVAALDKSVSGSTRSCDATKRYPLNPQAKEGICRAVPSGLHA
jgi:hypothetical protein